MATWDVFHSDRLEIERGLSSAQVRSALARGSLDHNDLVRPAGSGVAWTRLGDSLALLESEPEPPAASAAPKPRPRKEPPSLPRLPGGRDPSSEMGPSPGSSDAITGGAPPAREPTWGSEETLALPPAADEDFAPPSFDILDDDPEGRTHFDPGATESQGAFLDALIDDDEDDLAADAGHDTYLDALVDADDEVEDLGALDLSFKRGAGQIALPLESARSEQEEFTVDGIEVPDDDTYDPQDEDEEAAGFTLSRGGAQKVEELDLAAMVDVAFQLVLFFLVTATTVLYKTLEVPKPNPESTPAAATQGQGKTLDDLQEEFILVDIDPQGAFRIDREPVAANLAVLIDRLRAARGSTGRRAMLLTADAHALHKQAVLAYDAANEIGLSIAIARPAGGAGGGGGGAAPPPPPIPKKGAAG